MYVLGYVFLAITLGALAYAIVALVRVLWFRAYVERFDRAPPAAMSEFQGITILKPVSGVETGLYENLCSFCAQDYPKFQIIFGISDADDPARAIIEDVVRAYPTASIALVVGRARDVPNLKVAQLMQMLAAVTHNILVVADSDTRVDARYLRALAAAFAGERVGAVTCAYRGQPRAGVVGALGALMIDDQFIPSALVAAGGGLRFCLGATMALTRPALDAIGGFAAVANYLADDQMLGELVSRQGLRVVFAPYVVAHVVDEPDLAALWSHELRWARTSRAARPWGYTGYFLTFAWPPALIHLLIAGPTLLAAVLLAGAVVLRLGLHYASRSALRSRTPDAAWLIPLRDGLGLTVWAASFFGRGVRWRDRDLRIDARGRII